MVDSTKSVDYCNVFSIKKCCNFMLQLSGQNISTCFQNNKDRLSSKEINNHLIPEGWEIGKL